MRWIENENKLLIAPGIRAWLIHYEGRVNFSHRIEVQVKIGADFEEAGYEWLLAKTREDAVSQVKDRAPRIARAYVKKRQKECDREVAHWSKLKARFDALRETLQGL